MNSAALLPPDATWTLEGRLLAASNVVVRLRASTDDDAARGVYKPMSGERPLHDFPRGSLAHREVATWLVAQAGGWSCVPETRWFDGEFGPGSLQRWVGPLEGSQQSVVGLVAADAINPDDFAIAEFESDQGEIVLVHADDARLREIALLDVICNNADRKGSHVLEVGDTLYAIDNGLTFHVEDKLRTVVWGWSELPLSDAECERLTALLDQRDALDTALAEHLSQPEITALWERVESLLASGVWPHVPEERYGLPWPPL